VKIEKFGKLHALKARFPLNAEVIPFAANRERVWPVAQSKSKLSKDQGHSYVYILDDTSGKNIEEVDSELLSHR